MKKCLLIALVIFAFLLKASPSVNPPVSTWRVLPIQEAERVLQNHRAEIKTKLTFVRTSATPDKTNLWKNVYIFKDERFRYKVCLYNADVYWVSDELFLKEPAKFYGEPRNPAAFHKKEMSQADAERIARDYMQKHFPYPSLLNQTLSEAWGQYELGKIGAPTFTSAYCFKFIQRLNGGIEGPAYCEVMVDTVKGRVVGYRSHYFPVTLNLSSTLTDPQVLEIADKRGVPAGQASGIFRRYISEPDAFGVQRLIYRVIYPENSVEVDAHDGTILSIDRRTQDPSFSELVDSLKKKLGL